MHQSHHWVWAWPVETLRWRGSSRFALSFVWSLNEIGSFVASQWDLSAGSSRHEHFVRLISYRRLMLFLQSCNMHQWWHVLFQFNWCPWQGCSCITHATYAPLLLLQLQKGIVFLFLILLHIRSAYCKKPDEGVQKHVIDVNSHDVLAWLFSTSHSTVQDARVLHLFALNRTYMTIFLAAVGTTCNNNSLLCE